MMWSSQGIKTKFMYNSYLHYSKEDFRLRTSIQLLYKNLFGYSYSTWIRVD
jgi:hypothetical protein